MNDTDPRMGRKFQEMLMGRTPQERAKMGFSMFDMSRRLMVSSILERDPRISAALLRCEIFLRFYGHEFDEKTRGKIVEHLMKWTP